MRFSIYTQQKTGQNEQMPKLTFQQAVFVNNGAFDRANLGMVAPQGHLPTARQCSIIQPSAYERSSESCALIPPRKGSPPKCRDRQEARFFS